MPPDFCAFLSDYGTVDEFAGVCRAVMLGLAPHLRIVDITHEIPPHDVRAGALALVRSVQYLPQGLVLAVVDPGVGTERRGIAVEAGGSVLVGPDNGLLAPAVALLGGARRVVHLADERYRLVAPGPTFDGRDVFAPAVGYIAAGTELGELGEDIEPASLVPGVVPLPTEDETGIAGEVWWVDRFGNCQLNVDPGELTARGGHLGATVEVHLEGSVRMARWVRTYTDAKPSELVLLVDSYGLLSLAMHRTSAARECGIGAGAAVTLVTPEGGAR